jgi:diguanylate cyclase (GGDEF)-like protein
LNPKLRAPHRVLVIDDSDFIHQLVKVRLRQEGLEVISEHEGERGIERAGAELPDLILLDVDLPNADGFEVCRRLKELPTTRHIPIIFLTGTTSTESKVRGLDLGAVDYVTKPFDEVELRARVRAALRTKRLQDILEQQSFLDALTGLWNRAYLNRRLEAEVNVAQRYGRPLSILLADIDHFKLVNDSHGHLLGDVVLQGVALELQDCARRSDIVTRFGGEELAVLLTDTMLKGALGVAERLRVAIESRVFDTRQDRISVTASLGVASSDEIEGPLTPAALLGAADQALYAAKDAGRNCVFAHTRSGVRRVTPRDLEPSDAASAERS